MRDPNATDTTEVTSDDSEAQGDLAVVGRYRCMNADEHGVLCLDTEGAHFETQFSGTKKWRLKYTELTSMQKVTSHGTCISKRQANPSYRLLARDDGAPLKTLCSLISKEMNSVYRL